MNRNRPQSQPGQLQLGDLDPQTVAHSQKLAELIIDEMAQQGGQIPFIRFMELLLHAPGLGYYSAGAHKIGEAGDFITAPEISPLFSRCIARQCRQVLAQIGGGVVLEVGAGSGAMAVEVMLELARLDCLPERYFILDLSADLRERQRAHFEQQAPQLLERVEWLDALPESDFKGVVLANELLDAMPVHMVRFDPSNPQERYVRWSGERFEWCDGPLSDGRLDGAIREIIAECGHDGFGPDYISEINLAAGDWVRSIASVLEQGLVLLIDYGFPRSEFYFHERGCGTLMCHYRHQAHTDPLILPGLQDVTAHVNFTAVAESAVDAGLDVMGYTTQAHFLLGAGLMEVLNDANDGASEEQQIIQAQAVKKLTMPQEMGELFKVIALGKALEPGLIGFGMLDARGRL